MYHRKFKVTEEKSMTKGQHGLSRPVSDKNAGDVGRPNSIVLQELGNQLHVKAERMRLLAKAEEGLESGDFNPYATVTISPENKMIPSESPLDVKKGDNQHQVDRPIAVPPSAARKKRRELKSKVYTAPTSSVNIKQYRPGYTWNKGGRMKELRIRHLARKFLLIWKYKVFGRVTPSQARDHYVKSLMKKCFKAWHGVWWELRKEWRLIVRAECHHRFVLFTKTLRAWKDFLAIKKVKNAKIALAEKHASIKFQRKCFDAWLVYVDYRRKKSKRKQQAVSLYNNNLERKYWSHWTAQHEVILQREHMEVVALQFWAYRLQAQHWLIWQHKMSLKKKSVQDHDKAIRHHNTVVANQCFQAWMNYWARRRQKKQEKVFAVKKHKRMVVNRCFKKWLDCYRFRQAVYERQERMEELAAIFQKRWMFVHWRHYIAQIHEEQTLMKIAENHHRKKLLMAGFSAFRLRVVQEKLKVMREEMADQLRYKQLLKYGWNTWLLRCEDKEELQIVLQSQRAWKHYRSVTLRKCLQQLYKYAVWRQNRKAQYARADAHFYVTEMPKYMFAWKIFVQLMKNKRENKEKHQDFRRENLQARFFYMWVSQFEISRDNRMNERMAILHYDEHLARRFFTCWKQKTVDVQQEQENEEIAAVHYNEVLCRIHFHAWKSYITQLKKSQEQDIEATTHHSKRLIKICFQAWKQFAVKQRSKKQKSSEARSHYQRVLCKKMMAMWLHYVDMQRLISQRVEIMYQKQGTKSLRSAFLTWKDNVKQQISDRQAEKLAERHYQIVILSKVFKCWHRFSAIHAYKKSERRQWVQTARDYLNTKVLQVYFKKWQQNYQSHKVMRQKEERAVTYHNLKVKLKVLKQWKIFMQEKITKTLLKKQSDWFLSVRLKARYFIAWKHSLLEMEREKEKTNLALWHWCLTLHRKVLIAWFSYTQHRKHKKALVVAAMDRRRKRMLKQGVFKWLCVADDLSAMRKNFAVQQQAQSAFEKSRRVLKIGLHWKHWAARRQQSRLKDSQETPRSLISMPVLPVERGDHSCQITPRSVASENVVLDLNKRRELKMKSTHLPAPAQTVSPGRSVVAVSRIASAWEQERVKVQQRARPRKPDFLIDSLKRAGLFSPVVKDNLSVGPPVSVQSHRGVGTTRMDIHADKTVEKLDLSNVVSNQSVASTDRTDHTVTKRTENNVQAVLLDVEGLATTDESLLSNHSESQVMPPAGWMSASQSDKVSSKVLDTDLRLGPNPIVPKSHNIVLMTPADFLSKSDSSASQGQQVAGDIQLDMVSVASQSVASTPRVLCQIADHDHPLSETCSFKVTDLRSGGITPRSTVSSTTPREQLISLGFEPFVSKQKIEKEIVSIRNRLKLFDQKKKKMRTMQKQLKQLSDWLHDLEVRGQSSDDADVGRVKQEIEELTMDISVLKNDIEKDKGECTGLVERVKILMSQLNTV